MRNEHTVTVPESEHVSARARMMVTLFGAFWAAGTAMGAGAAIWLRTMDAVAAGTVAGLVVGALCLLALASHDLLDALETATQRDIDGDGAIGERIVLVRARQPQETKSDFADFVQGCQVDTSARRWEPIVGRGRYTEWRDSLLSGGWAVWNVPGEPRKGWKLSASTDEILQAIEAE